MLLWPARPPVVGFGEEHWAGYAVSDWGWESHPAPGVQPELLLLLSLF